MELNTTNPHCFTYQTEESAIADRLLMELLGGIRIEVNKIEIEFNDFSDAVKKINKQ